MSEPVSVSYEAYVYSTRLPFRYTVVLAVDGIRTRIQTSVWGRKRADNVMHFMVNNGNELLNRYGVAAELAAEIYARRREEAMAKVQVGDRVKLLVDIGQYKKGRVCKVAEVAEPSFYEARGGAPEWDDEEYPVKVLPVHSPTDQISLGPKDYLPLRRGEFGPLDQEVDE
jgi:hypothetical protein